MLRTAYSLLLLLPLLLCFREASAKVESLALFVGVDEGLSGDRDLKYASRDAQRMAAVIRELGGYDKDRLYLLTNPSLERVKSVLVEMRGRLKELRKSGVQTSVLLYYSGHGSAEGLHVKGKRFPREEVNELLESLESDLKILILDACESGDFLRSKGGSIVEDRRIEKQDRLKSHGTIVLSSSARGELAQESEDYKGAIFSHHLVNGLRGLADYDSDGEVSLLEAFDYARASTRMEEIRGRSERQNPAFDFDVVGESDPVLARLERARSRIHFRGMPLSALEIYDAQSQELEHRIYLANRDSAWYHLPAGKYLLRYADGDGHRVAGVDLSWVPEARVSPGDFRKQGRTLLSRKGAFDGGPWRHGLQLYARTAGPLLDRPLLGGEYVFRTTSFKHFLGFAFGREWSASDWDGIRIGTDVYRTGYGLRGTLFSRTYAQLQAGADLAYHRVVQTVRDTRFGNQQIMAGGQPVDLERTAKSNVVEAGLPLDLELYFPMRTWLGISASWTAYRYRERESGRSGWTGRLEPGLTLGHQF